MSLPPFSAHLIFFSLFAGGLALDLASKFAVFARLGEPGAEPVSIVNGIVRLVAYKNDGAAFGIAAGQRGLLIAVSVVALLVVVGLFLLGGRRHRLVHIALGLFAAGVCGNLYDRIFNDGFVRDFIDVVYWPGKHWPAFNVADSMLCIAVALLIASSIFTRKPYQERVPPQK